MKLIFVILLVFVSYCSSENKPDIEINLNVNIESQTSLVSDNSNSGKELALKEEQPPCGEPCDSDHVCRKGDICIFAKVRCHMTCGQNPGGKSVGRSYGRSNDKYPPKCKTSRDCYNNRTVNAICTDGFCMGNQEVKNLEYCIKRRPNCCNPRNPETPICKDVRCKQPLCMEYECKWKKCGMPCEIPWWREPGTCDRNGKCLMWPKEPKCYNDEDCWFKRCGKRCKVPGAKDDGLCDFGGKCQTRPRTVNLDYLQCDCVIERHECCQSKTKPCIFYNEKKSCRSPLCKYPKQFSIESKKEGMGRGIVSRENNGHIENIG